MADLRGRTYGCLTVIEDSGKRYHKGIIWRCLCECGVQTLVTTNALNMGNTKSCGSGRHRIKLPSGEAGLRELHRSYCRDARKRGLAFELGLERFRILITQPCTYCGAHLTQVKHSRGIPNNPAYPASRFPYTGLDRIDSSLGYIEGNLAPCCGMCNIAKRDHSAEEFIAWISRAYHHLVALHG